MTREKEARIIAETKVEELEGIKMMLEEKNTRIEKVHDEERMRLSEELGELKREKEFLAVGREGGE